MEGVKLSDRFEQALVYASRLHRSQVRKGTTIPYVSHLLSVTALVLENGGSEDEADTLRVSRRQRGIVA